LKDKIFIHKDERKKNKKLNYQIHKIINKEVECSRMVVTSNHLTLCKDRTLSLMNFDGKIEREWIFDDLIQYMKIIGGPSN
jgi:hypothetical protein